MERAATRRISRMVDEHEFLQELLQQVSLQDAHKIILRLDSLGKKMSKLARLLPECRT
jgi:hypothetical protein